MANSSCNVNLFGGKVKHTLDLRPGAASFVEAQPQMGLTIGIITLSPVSESQRRSDTAALHKIDGACQAA